MGLFDWFRGKRTRAAEAASVERLLASVAQPRPLVYMFQHVALREAAFENHPELMRDLADGSADRLGHFWSRARVRCIQAGMLDPADDAADQAEVELRDAVAVHTRRRDGHTVHVVRMPPPRVSPEAYLVAIVFRDGEPHEYGQPSPGTRYLTLELTVGLDRPMLCEWTRDGTHANYGLGPLPDVESFVGEVFARLRGGAGA